MNFQILLGIFISLHGKIFRLFLKKRKIVLCSKHEDDFSDLGGMNMNNYEKVEWFNEILWCINIVRETEKSVLVEIPEGAKYAGYTFWHSKRLVRHERCGYSFSYNSDFTFRLKKDRQKSDETILTADELREVYVDHYLKTSNRMD